MKNLLISLAFLILAISYSEKTPATPLITLDLIPSTPKIHPPETFYVDIEVSGLHTAGLNALIGSFNFDVNFDPHLSVFFTAPAGFGPSLGDIDLGQAIGDADDSTPGLLRLAEISLLEATCSSPPCSDPVLQDLQTDSFKLATVGFIASSGLTSPISFSLTDIVLGDPFGQPIMDDSGQLVPIVTQPVSVLVSEPSSLNLEIIALAALALMRRNTYINRTYANYI